MIRLTLLGAVALSLTVAATAGAQPPARAAKACSSKALHFERENIQGVSFSVAVKKLRAESTTCRNAKKIATVAAKHTLGGAGIPATIRGFATAVEEPCTGCTPVTEVTATREGATVTFKILGGA